MATASIPFRLTPENEDDRIVVSKKGLAELKRRADEAEERAREIERPRSLTSTFRSAFR